MRPELEKYEKLSMLFIQKYESYLPTAFDESMTILEKMNKIIEYMNKIGLLTQSIIDKWNEVMEWLLNEGLEQAVLEKLTEWLEDGTLADLINEVLLKDINDKLDELLNIKYTTDFIIMPLRREKDDRRTYLYLSQNGYDFKKLSDTPMISDSADTSLYFKNGWFYMASSFYVEGSPVDFRFGKSKNLVDWEYTNVNVGLRLNGIETVGAPEFFEASNGKLYITMHGGTGTIVDIVGNNAFNARCYISEVTNLENVTITNARLLGVQLVENTSKIDPALYEYTTGYQLLVKDEYDKKIEVWQSEDLMTWTKQVNDISQFSIFPAIISASDNFVEAPHAIRFKNKTFVYVDYSVRGHMGVATSNGALSSFDEAKPINITDLHRHGTPLVVKDVTAKRIVGNYMQANSSEVNQNFFKKFSLFGLTNGSNVVEELKPQFNTVYQLNGAEHIVINKVSNPYNIKRFSIQLNLNASGSITIKNNGNIILPLDEIVLKPYSGKNLLYHFEWMEETQQFQMVNKVNNMTPDNRIKIGLSTLATGGVVTNFNPKNGNVYNVTGSETITINSAVANVEYFYLVVSASATASITIANGATGFSLPTGGSKLHSDYGDGNILYKFVNDNGAYRITTPTKYDNAVQARQFKEGSADPTNNAEFKGQMYRNTTTGKIYLAVATTGNFSDWIILN